MYFTYILNIDIDIAIFCKYRIEIEKVISKHHYSGVLLMKAVMHSVHNVRDDGYLLPWRGASTWKGIIQWLQRAYRAKIIQALKYIMVN